jgi:hypothetical protein
MVKKGVSNKAKKRALKSVNTKSGKVKKYNEASARSAKRQEAQRNARGENPLGRYRSTDGRARTPRSPGTSERSDNFVKDAATARKLRLAESKARSMTRRKRAKTAAKAGAAAGAAGAAASRGRRRSPARTFRDPRGKK